MRVDAANRDALARIAERDLGGVSMDEALRILVFEHDTHVALTRLAADPAAMGAYLAEAADLADVDVQVSE
jgi:hypothetical protein